MFFVIIRLKRQRFLFASGESSAETAQLHSGPREPGAGIKHPPRQLMAPGA